VKTKSEIDLSYLFIISSLYITR